VTQPPPCRLFFILARNAPVGVLFRRGPTRWVQLIRWDTETDTFQPGQWFHGRIYEKRGDLSPDGTKLIYFASKQGRWNGEDAEGFRAEVGQGCFPLRGRTARTSRYYTPSWTAVSKPPYLTALALWPKGGDTWNGGGLWETDDRLWLNHDRGDDRPHQDHLPRGIQVTARVMGGEDELLNHRLERDGWKKLQPLRARFWSYVMQRAGIREKPHPGSGLVLRLTETVVRFEQTYRFSVRYPDGREEPLPDAAWADWDHQGRLVWVGGGKVFAARPHPDGLRPQELADFNSHKPDPRPSPESARTW